ETCVAGKCASGTALVCDDGDSCTADSCGASTGCGHVVSGSCCRTPLIAHEANTAGAVGAPYRYSVTGAPSLTKGTGPTTWSACSGAPAGFHIDATTGTIDWLPSAPG